MKKNLKSIIAFVVVLTCMMLLFSGCKTTVENDLYKQPISTQEPTKQQMLGIIFETQVPKTEQKATDVPQTPKPTKKPEVSENKTTEEEVKQQKPNKKNDVVVFDGVAPTKEPKKENKTNTEKEQKNYCSLVVSCQTILDNMDKLKKEKHRLVPADGIILYKENIEFNDGESAFNVLLRELKREKIHMEFVDTPMYNSVYIEGINNIYEFDCGSESGWTYSVNEWIPNYGISQHILKNGDKIKIFYVCDRKEDVF